MYHIIYYFHLSQQRLHVLIYMIACLVCFHIVLLYLCKDKARRCRLNWVSVSWHRDAQKVVRNVQEVFEPHRVGPDPLQHFLRPLRTTQPQRGPGSGAWRGAALGDGGRGRRGWGGGHRPVQLLQAAASGGRIFCKPRPVATSAECGRGRWTELNLGVVENWLKTVALWWNAVGQQKVDWVFQGWQKQPISEQKLYRLSLSVYNVNL